MTKSFKTLSGRFLFRDRGILPTPRLIVGLMILSISMVGLSLIGISWVIVIMVNGGGLLLSLLDLRYSPSREQVTFKRDVKEEVERGRESEVIVKVVNHSAHPALFKLIDDFPQSFMRPFPLEGEVPTQQRVAISYPLIATVRGDYILDGLHVRYRSKIGLWEKQVRIPAKDSIRVIPNMTEVRHYLDDAQHFLMYEGVHVRKQQIGTGEFAKIRNYVVGDDLRKINWRQTAKLQQLMTNEYEPEHGKYMTILIDCGRMMAVELSENNRLERSLEAALTVAAAALKKGDYVSVIAFSKDVKAFVPPAKGMAHFQEILQQVYNLKADHHESNYAAVFQYLQTVQKKRSLLLLFSDVNTFLYEEASLFYLQRLRRKHVFLTIGIEDQDTEEKARIAPEDMKQAMVKSMAQRQILEKYKELTKWERQGLLMIEAPEEQLATTAVSHYIQIINRGVL